MKSPKKFNLMNKFNFDLMKKRISISWNSTSWSFPTFENQKNFNNMNSEKMILKVNCYETYLVYKLMIKKTISLNWWRSDYFLGKTTILLQCPQKETKLAIPSGDRCENITSMAARTQIQTCLCQSDSCNCNKSGATIFTPVNAILVVVAVLIIQTK